MIPNEPWSDDWPKLRDALVEDVMIAMIRYPAKLQRSRESKDVVYSISSYSRRRTMPGSWCYRFAVDAKIRIGAGTLGATERNWSRVVVKTEYGAAAADLCRALNSVHEAACLIKNKRVMELLAEQGEI